MASIVVHIVDRGVDYFYTSPDHRTPRHQVPQAWDHRMQLEYTARMGKWLLIANILHVGDVKLLRTYIADKKQGHCTGSEKYFDSFVDDVRWNEKQRWMTDVLETMLPVDSQKPRLR
jgi:hypothetical protein